MRPVTGTASAARAARVIVWLPQGSRSDGPAIQDPSPVVVPVVALQPRTHQLVTEPCFFGGGVDAARGVVLERHHGRAQVKLLDLSLGPGSSTITLVS